MGNASHATVTHRIDGVDYQLGPLELEDLEYLEGWMKGRLIDAANDAAQRLPKSQGDRLLRQAMHEASEIDIFGSDFSKLLTPAGVAQMLYRMARRHHPDITPEDTRKWLSSQEAAEAIGAKISLLQANAGSKEDTGNGAPLRQPRRVRKMNRKE